MFYGSALVWALGGVLLLLTIVTCFYQHCYGRYAKQKDHFRITSPNGDRKNPINGGRYAPDYYALYAKQMDHFHQPITTSTSNGENRKNRIRLVGYRFPWFGKFIYRLWQLFAVSLQLGLALIMLGFYLGAEKSEFGLGILNELWDLELCPRSLYYDGPASGRPRPPFCEREDQITGHEAFALRVGAVFLTLWVVTELVLIAFFCFDLRGWFYVPEQDFTSADLVAFKVNNSEDPRPRFFTFQRTRYLTVEVAETSSGDESESERRRMSLEQRGYPYRAPMPERYFFHMCERYVLSADGRAFRKAATSLLDLRGHYDEDLVRGAGVQHPEGLSAATVAQRQKMFGPNVITGATEPTFWNCVLEEFTGSFFYIFQLMSFWLWASVEELHIGLVWEAIFVTCGLWNAKIKKENLTQIHQLAKFKCEVDVKRENEVPTRVCSVSLVPGDHIRLEDAGHLRQREQDSKTATATLSCDCILVTGDLIMNEAALTGEATPVQKFAAPKELLDELNAWICCHGKYASGPYAHLVDISFGEPPQSLKNLAEHPQWRQHFLYAGTQVFSGSAIAVVYSIGVGTTRGKLVRQMLLDNDNSAEGAAGRGSVRDSVSSMLLERVDSGFQLAAMRRRGTRCSSKSSCHRLPASSSKPHFDPLVSNMSRSHSGASGSFAPSQTGGISDHEQDPMNWSPTCSSPEQMRLPRTSRSRGQPSPCSSFRDEHSNYSRSCSRMSISSPMQQILLEEEADGDNMGAGAEPETDVSFQLQMEEMGGEPIAGFDGGKTPERVADDGQREAVGEEQEERAPLLGEDRRKTTPGRTAPPAAGRIDDAGLEVVEITGAEDSSGANSDSPAPNSPSTPHAFPFEDEMGAFFRYLLFIGCPAVLIAFLVKLGTNPVKVILLITQVLTTMNNLVSPFLPVSLSNTTMSAARRLLKKVHMVCVDADKIRRAGLLKTFCFDKTGTLTHDGMDFAGCVVVVESKGEDFSSTCAEHQKDLHGFARNKSMQMEIWYKNAELFNESVSAVSQDFLCGLASCHSVSHLPDGSVIGNPVEKAMHDALGWELDSDAVGATQEKSSRDHSEDLQKPTSNAGQTPAAEQKRTYRYRPPGSKNRNVCNGRTERETSASREATVSVLERWQFDQTRQRQTVVVRLGGKQDINVFCKGSVERVAACCRPETVPSGLFEKSKNYSKQGYYVLGIATKKVVVDHVVEKISTAEVAATGHDSSATFSTSARDHDQSLSVSSGNTTLAGSPTTDKDSAGSGRQSTPTTMASLSPSPLQQKKQQNGAASSGTTATVAATPPPHRLERDEAESDLHFLGLILFQNRLKEESEFVIDRLQNEMGINCVMITGDAVHTGVTAATHCGLIPSGDMKRLFIGDLGEDGSTSRDKSPVGETAVQWEEVFRDDEEMFKSAAVRSRQERDETNGDFSDIHLALTECAYRQLCLEDRMSADILNRVKVFGRVKPDGKKRIVSDIQNEVEGLVGMVGDGGNDTVALKQADIGVALVHGCSAPGEDTSTSSTTSAGKDSDRSSSSSQAQQSQSVVAPFMVRSRPPPASKPRKTTSSAKLLPFGAARTVRARAQSEEQDEALRVKQQGDGDEEDGIAAIVALVLEGRCVLEASMNIFLWFIAFGILWVISMKTTMLLADAFAPMAAWFYADGFLTTMLPWAMTLAEPARGHRVMPTKNADEEAAGRGCGTESRRARPSGRGSSATSLPSPASGFFHRRFLLRLLLSVVCGLFTLGVPYAYIWGTRRAVLSQDQNSAVIFNNQWYSPVDTSRDDIETGAEIEPGTENYESALIFLNQALFALLLAAALSKKVSGSPGNDSPNELQQLRSRPRRQCEHFARTTTHAEPGRSDATAVSLWSYETETRNEGTRLCMAQVTFSNLNVNDIDSRSQCAALCQGTWEGGRNRDEHYGCRFSMSSGAHCLLFSTDDLRMAQALHHKPTAQGGAQNKFHLTRMDVEEQQPAGTAAALNQPELSIPPFGNGTAGRSWTVDKLERHNQFGRDLAGNVDYGFYAAFFGGYLVAGVLLFALL
eukprot:g5527.t1